MEEKPNYYSVLPSNVRYSKDLTSLEKLLYSEITCLTNYKGYCWATNNYFGKLYGKSKGTISRSINKLAALNLIDISISKIEHKIDKRLIKIKEIEVLKNIINHSQKSEGGVVKNDNDNIKLNIKKEKIVLFDEFWDAYNVKKSRKLCYDKFMALKLEVCIKCVDAAKIYSKSITDKQYQKHPGTWLNQGCWDDEIIQKTSRDRGMVQGGEYDGMVF